MTPSPEKSCCFTGHRKIDSSKLSTLVERLHLEIDYMIGCGISNFYTGGALGFDTLAALAVLLHKQRGEDVKLHLMLPCPEQYYRWKQRDIDIYHDILSKADSSQILSEHYHNGVMQIRNRAMVDASLYCISYWDKETAGTDGKGGTLYTVNYARKQHRKVINLWDEPPEDIQMEFNFTV